MSKYALLGMVLQVILFSVITAREVEGQNSIKNVFLNTDLNGSKIEEAFAKIENATEFTFSYKRNAIGNKKIQNISQEESSLADILLEIGRTNNLKFRRVNETIHVSKSTDDKGKVLEYDRTLADVDISGKVIDENGEGLPGASVVVKESPSIGTTTDLQGNYKLSVPNDAVLSISFVGYVTQLISVGNRAVIDVQMEVDSEQLDEVVVVGFGTQKKESVVGSINTVRPEELKVPSSNLTSALAGRVAGVIAYQRSGEPGADNAQFFVRGVTTFADGAVPLILIDGVELTADDLSRLQPDDIESFSVLKDATATAVYGARGANGIIYVTTKKGYVGAAKVSLRIENSVNENTKLPEFANPVKFMELYNEAVRTRDPLARLPFSGEKIISTRENRNPNVFPAVNWYDEVLKKRGSSQRVNFNVRGGGEVAQYYIAGSYVRDNGLIKRDDRIDADNNVKLDRYLLRSNVTVNLSKTTKATVRLHSTLDNLTGPNIPGDGSPGANLFARVLQTSPVRFPAIYEPDAANSLRKHTLFGNEINNNAYYINPLAESVSGFRRFSSAFSLLQLELHQDLKAVLPGLRFRFLGNSNRSSSFSNTRSSRPFFYNASEVNYDRINNQHNLSPLNLDQGDRSLFYLEGGRNVSNVLYTEFAFNYDQTFAEKHAVSGMLVGIAREFVDGNATSLELSLPSRNLGISGRFTYGYSSRYFVEFNFGYNGSERFAAGNRFGFFPSIGAGWAISEETFFESFSDVVSKLKIRGSYGIVGNDAIGDRNDRFFYLSQVNPNNFQKGYLFGMGSSTNFRPGVSIGRYENSSIAWETGKKFNIGVEMDLFDRNIQLRVDYFTDLRENILQSRLVPSSLGLQVETRANVGKAFTKGVDASLDLYKQINNDFWVAGRGTFTYSNGIYKEFEEPDYSLRNAPHRFVAATKIGQQLGYIAERLFIDNEDVRNAPQQAFGGPAPQAGDIKYKDVNSDGVINDLDRVPIGKPTTPQLTYGGGFSLGYKKWDISAFFQGVGETSLYINPVATAPFVTRNVASFDGVASQIGLGGAGNTIGEAALLKAYADDHWSEENRDSYALYPRLGPSPSPNNTALSTWWLRDGAFVRLKQVEIGYTITPEASAIQSVRFYATGTNLLAWSRFKLWDPEVGGNAFGYPLQRVLNVGILANF